MVPDEQIDARIRLGQFTPKQARKYRYTLKILELADRDLRSAEIAQTVDISLKDVQPFRRVAVDTLDAVNERIRARIDQAKDTQAQHAEHLETRHPKTLGPRARPAHESIVEPYRDRVIEALRQGGNHRTIHPLLQVQGFTGSANAVYQYILKLREEMPEAIRPVNRHPTSDWIKFLATRYTAKCSSTRRTTADRPWKARRIPSPSRLPRRPDFAPRRRTATRPAP